MSVHRVVLVGLAEPWPKPALGHPMVRSTAQILARSSVPTRVLLTSERAGSPNVEVFDRTERGTTVTSLRVGLDGGPALERLGATLRSTAVGKLGGAKPLLAPVFLICVQASHDLCCGSMGAALAGELTSVEGLDIRRVSHIGGHRFAPTLVELRTQRMWAYADVEMVKRVAKDSVLEVDLAKNCRGWMGANSAPEQVAEIAARISLDRLSLLGESARIEPVDTAKIAGATVFDVELGDRRARVGVEVSRQVPTVACAAPGGLPAKVVFEYKAVIIE